MVEPRRAQVGKYTIIKTLGEGGFGVAKSAETTDSKEQVALKILKKDFVSEELRKEIKILSGLNHKHIINLIEFLEKAPYRKKNGNDIVRNIIVMELASQGDLFVIVFATALKRKTGLSEKTTRTFFQQMVEAVEYCHGQGVVHRDIKPENVLLDKDYNIKLADFGWATFLDAKLHNTKAGTERYFAPEMWKFQPFEIVPIDVFCLGIMLFMMRLGNLPFGTATARDKAYKHLYNKTPDLYWKIIEDKISEKDALSFEFKTLIEGLMERDPKKRFTIADIKASKWYQGETADRNFIEQEIAILREQIDSIYKDEAEQRRKEKLKMSAAKNYATMEEETKKETVDVKLNKKMEEEIPAEVKKSRGESRTVGSDKLRPVVEDLSALKIRSEDSSAKIKIKTQSRSVGRDKLKSLDEDLLALEINLEDSSRKIKIKTQKLNAPFTFAFYVDLQLLFKSLVWVSKKLLLKSEIVESTYMIIGAFQVSDEMPKLVQLKIIVYQVGNEEEYTIEFVKTEGEYYAFTEFVYGKFFPALMDLVEEIS